MHTYNVFSHTAVQEWFNGSTVVQDSKGQYSHIPNDCRMETDAIIPQRTAMG